MTIVQPAAPRCHIEADPTSRDRQPWHLRGHVRALDLDLDDADTEDVTVVRPVAAARVTALAVVPPHVVPEARRHAPRGLPESIEHLSLPAGLHEEMLAPSERPHGDTQMRIAMVRLVRELGRDYRRWYGTTLRTDAAAIETMQKHLLGHAGEVLAGRMAARSLAPEVVRHGVALGEIVARRAGGRWDDLSGDPPALWSMSFASPGVLRPVARVHRFLLQRTREEDLVACFLNLEACTTNATTTATTTPTARG